MAIRFWLHVSGYMYKLQVAVGKSEVSTIRSKVSDYSLFYFACLSQEATCMRICLV